MHLASIFFHPRRHVHHTPDLLFAAVSPDEHRRQLARVETVGLRPPPPPIHLDARGIDDAVGDAAAHEIPMQPEAVAAGLVAAAHGRGRREPEVGLRTGDLSFKGLQHPRRDGAHKGRLIDPSSHRELPLGVAELEGDI